MPQLNILTRGSTDKTRREHQLEQQERVREGDGIHVLDEPTYNRAERRTWAAKATQGMRRKEKRRTRRHSLERRYTLVNGHFIKNNEEEFREL
jgi:hypothetical protein